MKFRFLYTLPLAILAATGCNDDNYDDVLNETYTADDLNIEVVCETPGSNMVIVRNHTKGVIPYWSSSMGISHRECDTIIAPFLGEFKVEFCGYGGGGITPTISRTVTIERMDYPTDEWYGLFAGSGTEGKKWVWDPAPNAGGRGGWGCYGAGGYGHAKDTPDWSCDGIGSGKVYADEYITFDLNGGANATLHKHDGTLVKGTFAFSKGTTADKAALEPRFRNGQPTGQGWLGTLTLTGVTPPAGYNYYTGMPCGPTFDIAVLSETELLLIQPDEGAILCDPGWASVSTHWCLVLDGSVE